MNIAPVEVTRDVTLNPGVMLDGKPLTACKIRLLTRGDNKFIAAAQESERDDVALARAIVQIGEIKEREIISSLLDVLTVPDELRIRDALARLEGECLKEAGGSTLDPLARILSPTDISSEPFALNPGIVIGAKKLTSCIVRLLTRGEWKKIIAETSTATRDDLALLHGIVQLGDQTNITMEHINALTDVDVGRINEEAERLRAQYAPESKSTCPECGHPLEA
jgi:hypothetical protein